MERRTYFVDVVLPLAIPGLLTYRVPHQAGLEMQPGMRVVVRLGRSKLYTALVHTVHEDPPKDYQAKFFEGILDDAPIVTAAQFKLWQWISEYYMCTLGEVMAAALPGAFRLASETQIRIDETWDGDQASLNDKEFLIFEGLQIQGTLSLKDIGELLDQKTVLQHVKSMAEKGVIITEEDLKNRYVPRMETWVRLHPNLHTDHALQAVFDELEKRSPRQLEMVMAFFHLSGTSEHTDRSVSRKKLQTYCEADATLTKRMVDKQIFELEQRQVDRMASTSKIMKGSPVLSAGQTKAEAEISEHWQTQDTVLLHGVTGSGKTEVYIRLMEQALSAGRQVLFLVPEIALTTQLTTRLKHVFGERIGVYHSKFNPQERVEIWKHVLNWKPGRYDIIVGARSAVLLPFAKLGLVIVDEEHESSYKQHNPAPRYHGRDVAMVLGRIFGAKVLLGSATPSIESYNNAKNKRFGLVEMNERYGGVTLPEIYCADIRLELRQKSMKGMFTQFLLDHMKAELKAGKQVILFQNRRGYSPLWQCEVCGDVPECIRCDVSLTYHKRDHQLKCHYCGLQAPPPTTCTSCGNHNLKMLGFGTEKIEEEVGLHFPDAKVQRLDLETTRSKHAYSRIIQGFTDGEIDVLVGTQMVTKGLDFGNVSLVGILNADQLIKFPDFRSLERSYQLMTQVAGRAGRRGDRGKVIIQTYSPDHWVIHRVMEHDYLGMYGQELPERETFLYPPFFRLIELTLRHRDDRVVDSGSSLLAGQLRAELGDRVLGPEKPYVARINNQYLRTILVKIEREASSHHVKQMILTRSTEMRQQADYKSLRIAIDVDPA